MTLKDTIKAIEGVASTQPSVRMIVRNDIFRLNKCMQARYAVFGWLQNQHTSGAASSLVTYGFTFFYVDRLTNDRSNEIDIQSVGISTLDNIIKALDEMGISAPMDYTFQVFNQRFLDECAGVFCNVTLEVPVDALCPEVFSDRLPDYNDDFNDDFLILD